MFFLGDTTMTTTTIDPDLASSAARSERSAPIASGGVHGAPRVLLRLEGVLVLGASIAAYAHLGGSWLAFALLFLIPDLSMLGYLAGPRIGAITYNAGHSLLAPGALAIAAVVSGSDVLVLGAVIWVAHIGFDRMLGYGLKYGTEFFDTHLGRVGRPRRA
ncbi:MAG: DUF4260 domain-containing protein [Myxococcota bacterium]|nr:DUF4260 domain-containing protein [Myxococcota bacterium]